MENYESIKARLLKIQALADKGYDGEAKAAKQMVEVLCKKYGISIEDILCRETPKTYHFIIGRNKIMFQLFVQCHGKVTNKHELEFKKYSSSEIGVELTPLQFAELSNLFDWHKQNFKKEIDNHLDMLLEAYINKHDLFSKDPDKPHKDLDLSPETIKKLMAILTIQGNLSDNVYLKMIEAK